MFSGKTEELLRKLNRLHYAKTDFLLFKPKIDNRYDATKVMSHQKSSMAAFTVESSIDILKYCENNSHIKHIGIDEIQFLPKDDPFNAVKLCKELKMRGYQIICSGLDMDYKGDPFKPMDELISIADVVHKLKAVCFLCGEDAGYTAKISTENTNIIDVGSDDKYHALCFNHWLEQHLESKKKKP